MPLSKDRRILGKMDTRIYIDSVATSRGDAGGPKKTFTENGPYWSFREYLTRKQGEIDVETRITSMQQVRFTLRYNTTVFPLLSKAGRIREVGSTKHYEIISVSKDTGRDQYIEVVTELKE